MTAESDLEAFIDRYDADVAAIARDVLGRMRARLPGAIALVYDDYNALAIGLGPNDTIGDAIFSVALYPRWVSLFFLQDGPRLPDPDELLLGAGNKVRHVVLQTADDLDRPEIQALISAALERARSPIDPTRPGGVVIKSVAAKQRPRRST